MPSDGKARLQDWIETSPQHLAMLCVVRADMTINLIPTDPAQWFFVIVDLHRALNCALVAALRGTAGIGAYPPKLRRRWLEYFDRSRTNDVDSPDSQRVEPFLELLRRAQEASPVLQGEHLTLTAERMNDLVKLNYLRDDIEHVKPVDWYLEVVGLPRICRAAAYALAHLFSLPPVNMHLSDLERADANRAIGRILELSDDLASV